MFKVWLFLAGLGFFTHEGLVSRVPFWMPAARIQYPDGKRSIKMPIGNAVGYKKIFGGKVIRP